MTHSSAAPQAPAVDLLHLFAAVWGEALFQSADAAARVGLAGHGAET